MVSFSELLSKAGQTTGDFLVDAGNKIADKYCEVYRDYPQFVVGFGTDPLQPFRRAMVDSLCNGREPGLPPSPAPQFTGGQCLGDFYIVDFTADVVEKSSGDVLTWNGLASGYGKLLGMRTGSIPEDDASVYLMCYEADGVTRIDNIVTYGSPELFRVKRVEITNVTNIGNPSDTCGDPPPDYPTVVPPDEALKPPVPYTPPSGSPSFNIPVVFVPVTNNLNIPVNLSLDVDFNFNFDAGGLSFGDGNGGGGGDGSFTPDDRAALTQAGNNAANAANAANGAKNAAEGAGDAANAAKNAAEAAKDAADAAKRNTDPPPPPGSPETDEEDKSPDDNDRNNVENLLYVKITLTQLPTANKTQWGEGAPDVYYAGWFEWKFGGFPAPREPIHFAPSLFVAPKGANGYAYTLTGEAEGFATEITRKVEV